MIYVADLFSTSLLVGGDWLSRSWLLQDMLFANAELVAILRSLLLALVILKYRRGPACFLLGHSTIGRQMLRPWASQKPVVSPWLHRAFLKQ